MGSIVVPDPPCESEACRTLLADLAKAADHRDVIGMAKGILMAQSECTPEGAFEMLRHASMRENVRIYEIAHRFVDSRSRPPAAAGVTSHAEEPARSLV